MSHILVSHRLEISYHEAFLLCIELSGWLKMPIGQGVTLTPFELLAAGHLRNVAKKMYRCNFSNPTKLRSKNSFKLTFSAQEIISLHQIIVTYPPELNNFMMSVDQAALTYDQFIYPLII